MKRLFMLLFLAFPFVATAQLTKGTVFLGGSLSESLVINDYHPGTIGTTKMNSFSISPSIGIMSSEKLAWGVALNYAATSTTYDSFNQNTGTVTNNKTVSSSYGIAPFARYYMPLSNAFYFVVQGTAGAARGTGTATVGNSSSESSYYTLNLTFKPVLVFFPSPKWAVEGSIGSLGYFYNRYLPDAQSTTSFGLGWGSLTFGVSYFFIKK